MNTNRNPLLYFRSMILNVRNQRLLVFLAASILGSIFLLVAYQIGKAGFPLDDSWIHQTYARNFAASGAWEYIPGSPSAGSTAPLWTMMLSLGYTLGIRNPFIWTNLLSMIFFAGLGVIFFETIRKCITTSKYFALGGSLLFVMDWHLLWSTASGMETILFCFLELVVFLLLLNNKYYFLIGFICGLLVWVRPDGITFVGPVMLILGWGLVRKKTNLRSLLGYLLPLLGLLVLYGLFNYSLSGSVLPNTFFAKQLEYSSELSAPLAMRLQKVFIIPTIGAGLFLIPGFLFSIYKAIKVRSVWMIGVILWFLGYGLLYAVRLPLIYQHGRYLFPLIPVYFMLGMLGSRDLIQWIGDKREQYMKLVRLIAVCAFGSGLVFIISGEVSLVEDIQTIDQLMVQPAIWIRENTPEDSVIAAHDIGALGYFGERKILDLAGLIQTDVIPIIRDEEKLIDHMANNEAQYLVVFSDWYTSFDQLGHIEKTFTLSNEQYSEMVEIRKLVR